MGSDDTVDESAGDDRESTGDETERTESGPESMGDETESTAGSGWLARRRASKRERTERDRAEREAARVAERDERYRDDLDAQRSLTGAGDPPEARMRRAIAAIRREGYKVAVIYAVVDAALAALVVNLLVGVFDPDWLPTTLPLPRVLLEALVPHTGTLPPVPTSIVVGLAAGVVVFAVELVGRTRRPIVEQFEDANPEVREALRTARDAVRSGKESRMAVALYEDVLARLRRSSSFGLVNLKRVLVTVLLVSAVSVASIQVAVVDLEVGASGTDRPGTDADGGTSEYQGLQDASGVLGEPEDVTAGEETLDTTIATQGGGDDGDTGTATAYDSSGFSGGTEVEAQEAGFAEREQLEDAELIREYNLRIRSEDDT